MKRLGRSGTSGVGLPVKVSETGKKEVDLSRPADLLDEGISVSPHPEVSNLAPNQKELERLYRNRKELLEACQSPNDLYVLRDQVREAFSIQDHDSQPWSLMAPLWALAKFSNFRGYADRQKEAKNKRDELVALIEDKLILWMMSEPKASVPKRLLDIVGQAEIDLPELGRIINDLKQIRFSDLEPQVLDLLGKSRDVLVKRLSLLIAESTEKDKPLLEQLKSELENLVILSGGSRVRFRQARPRVDYRLAIQLTDPAAAKRYMRSALSKASDEEGWQETILKYRFDPLFKVTKERMDRLKEDPSRFITAPNYTNRFHHPENEMELAYADKLRKDGLEYAAVRIRHDVPGKDISAIKESVLEVSKQKQVALLGIPSHALMISTDPQAGSYRFFEPNLGIYKFDDPEIFAETVSDYLNSMYNGAEGFDPKRLSSHLEVSVNQGGDQQLHLNQGVCRGLCVHVAKWLLEHPDFRGELTPEMLGLYEFEMLPRYQTRPEEERARLFSNFFVTIDPLKLRNT